MWWKFSAGILRVCLIFTCVCTLCFLALFGCRRDQVVTTIPWDADGVASVSAAPRRTTPRSTTKRGVHTLLSDTFYDWPVETWPIHLEYAHRAIGRPSAETEGGFVTQLIDLNHLDVATWQTHFFDPCHRLGLTPIVRIAINPDPTIGGWDAPPQDAGGGYDEVAQTFAEFFAQIDWPDGVPHYFVIGNEPNHGEEWGGRVDPAEYARYLITMADALHTSDPEARILNAGLDLFAPHTNGQKLMGGGPFMDAESFMDGMIAAQPHVFTYLDAWASHPYPLGAFVQPPWEQSMQVDYLNGASNPNQLVSETGIFNRGINGYEWELLKLSTYGIDALPVFITETGWRHSEAGYASAETVAIYLELATVGNKQGRYPELPTEGWTAWEDDQRVVAITPFAFAGDPSRWSHSNWITFTPEGDAIDVQPMVDFWSNGRFSLP